MDSDTKRCFVELFPIAPTHDINWARRLLEAGRHLKVMVARRVKGVCRLCCSAAHSAPTEQVSSFEECKVDEKCRHIQCAQP